MLYPTPAPSLAPGVTPTPFTGTNSVIYPSGTQPVIGGSSPYPGSGYPLPPGVTSGSIRSESITTLSSRTSITVNTTMCIGTLQYIFLSFVTLLLNYCICQGIHYNYLWFISLLPCHKFTLKHVSKKYYRCYYPFMFLLLWLPKVTHIIMHVITHVITHFITHVLPMFYPCTPYYRPVCVQEPPVQPGWDVAGWLWLHMWVQGRQDRLLRVQTTVSSLTYMKDVVCRWCVQMVLF